MGVSERDHLLECPVCYDRMIPPIPTCENGHGICRNCRKSIKHCGLCKKRYTENQNTLLDQLVATLPSKCKFEGCDETFLPTEIENHEKKCYHKKIQCSYCLWEIPIVQLRDHFQNKHRDLAESQTDSSEFQRISMHKNNLLYVANVDGYFMVRSYKKNNISYFGVQYLGGNQQEASKYAYDIRIDQGLPPPNKHYFQRRGICIPYTFLADEILKEKNVMDLNLEKIILSEDEHDSGLQLEIRITKLSSSRDRELETKKKLFRIFIFLFLLLLFLLFIVKHSNR